MKENKNLTAQYIKMIVERNSGVEDISVKSRKMPLPDLRHIYYELCRIYSNMSQVMVAELVNVDRSTVSEARLRFENKKDQKYYQQNMIIYNTCEYEIESFIRSSTLKPDWHLKTMSLESYYRIKYLKIIEHRQKVVATLQSEIDYLLNQVEVKYSIVTV